MTARVFVQRRIVVGLRPLAIVLVSLLGAAAGLFVPGFIGIAIVVGMARLGVGDATVPVAILSFVLSWTLVAHVVGRGLEASARLRAPWGRIAVGSEGVRWDGWVRRVLTRWRDVEEVTRQRDATVLLVAPGRHIVLASPDVLGLAQAIEELRAANATATRAEIPAALASDRDTERWIGRTRTLLGRDSYRTAGVSLEQLARVLEDASAPAATRIGAAAALLGAGAAHAELVARVKDESVDEDLTRALEDALAGRFVAARWARLCVD
jgi:hypothetical protein